MSNSHCLCRCGALPFSPLAPTTAPPAGHGQVGPSHRAPSPTGTAHRAPCTAAAKGEGFGHKNPVPPFRRRKGTRGLQRLPRPPLPLQSKHAGGHPLPGSTAEAHLRNSTPARTVLQPTQNVSWLRRGTVPRDPSHSPHRHHGTRSRGRVPWHRRQKAGGLGGNSLDQGTEESRQGGSLLPAFGSFGSSCHGQDKLLPEPCRSGGKSRAQTVSRAFGIDSEAEETEQVQESILLQPSVLVLEEQKVFCPITCNGCSLATEGQLSHPLLQYQSHPAACWWPSHTTAQPHNPRAVENKGQRQQLALFSNSAYYCSSLRRFGQGQEHLKRGPRSAQNPWRGCPWFSNTGCSKYEV